MEYPIDNFEIAKDNLLRLDKDGEFYLGITEDGRLFQK